MVSIYLIICIEKYINNKSSVKKKAPKKYKFTMYLCILYKTNYFKVENGSFVLIILLNAKFEPVYFLVLYMKLFI